MAEPTVQHAPTGALAVAAPTLALWTVADYLLVSLGLFSVMPVLARLLAGPGSQPDSAAVGTGLFTYTMMAGGSSLLVNRWIPRFRYGVALAGSAVLCAVGFGLLPYIHRAGSAAVLLLLAGMGSSVHFQVARVLIAELFPGDIERNESYSNLQIAVNVAATVGPFVASFLLPVAGGRLLLLIVSVCYLCAAVLVLVTFPRNLSLSGAASPWPVSRSTGRAVLHNPVAVRTIIVTTTGSFLYAQFFSAFALLVAQDLADPMLRGAFLAAPAASIVLLQRPVARGMTRMMRRDVRPLTLLRGGTLAFGAAMALLGTPMPVVVACCAAVVVFSLAEMVFTPMASTAFTALRIGSSLEALNIRQCAWTVGEALGSLSGGGLFLLLATRGSDRLYWLALATAALVGTLLPGIRQTRPRHRRLSGPLRW